jgi:hypothetical protein
MSIAVRPNSALFYFVAQKPLTWVQAASLLTFLDHTILGTHTLGRTPLNEWSARRRGRYLPNTQQTQKKNIHALSEIRTRDPKIQVAADQRLRPHSHRDRLTCPFCILNFKKVT